MWSHDLVDEAVEMFSEVGPDGYERRKIELFRDGRLGWADEASEVGGTGLGEVPVTSIDEINAQREFQASVVTAAQFDQEWQRAVTTYPGAEPPAHAE